MNITENAEITYSENCSDSFRKKIIKDFYLAFTTGNMALSLSHVENDVHWQITDLALIIGKEQFANTVGRMMNFKIKTIHIKNIIVNSRTSAVNGVLHSADHKNYSFCDIFHFSNSGENAKVQRISTYMNNLQMEIPNIHYH